MSADAVDARHGLDHDGCEAFAPEYPAPVVDRAERRDVALATFGPPAARLSFHLRERSPATASGARRLPCGTFTGGRRRTYQETY